MHGVDAAARGRLDGELAAFPDRKELELAREGAGAYAKATRRRKTPPGLSGSSDQAWGCVRARGGGSPRHV